MDLKIPPRLVPLPAPLSQPSTWVFCNTKPDIKPNPASRKRLTLTLDQKDVLITWYGKNLEMPYPTKDETEMLSHQADLSYTQVTNWFTNVRRRGVGSYPAYHQN